MQSMLICNDNDPYIYAYNDRTWNKAYSKSSYTKTADGQIPRGSCNIVILDTDDKYQNAIGFKIARGAKAIEMISMGWDISFDRAKPNLRNIIIREQLRLPAWGNLIIFQSFKSKAFALSSFYFVGKPEA